MSELKIIEAVRKFVKTCPHIKKFNEGIGVNFLKEDPISYVIETAPSEPIVEEFMDGGSDRQYVFNFASRESYGADIRQNIDSCGFYEAFADWLEEQTEKGEFPTLGEKKIPYEIKAITSGYVDDVLPGKAKYVIQCRLLYFKE